MSPSHLEARMLPADLPIFLLACHQLFNIHEAAFGAILLYGLSSAVDDKVRFFFARYFAGNRVLRFQQRHPIGISTREECVVTIGNAHLVVLVELLRYVQVGIDENAAFLEVAGYPSSIGYILTSIDGNTWNITYENDYSKTDPNQKAVTRDVMFDVAHDGMQFIVVGYHAGYINGIGQFKIDLVTLSKDGNNYPR